ncbi:MAG: hypothetical protein QOD57_4260 [Actinomycetota bacterium]|jgi:ABC-type branched-subunit amino acid transport system ATPase component|nr:hypothetical protein [Actinomycetota bacterium]
MTEPGTGRLAVSDLTVAYGGALAVDSLSLTVPAERIMGLIGPNGAGKTTTFNALSGLVTPRTGSIRLLGEDVSTLPPQARARRGLGRTFQKMQLFDSLTVGENVALGHEAKKADSRPWRHVFASKADRISQMEAAEAALELCDLEPLAGERVGALPTGERRRVELARVVAGEFTVLLLDEPSSGLDSSETQQFAAVLRQVVASGRSILLVEHDMALVMEICHYLYVLDFGKLIFEGPPAAVLASPEVRDAYLGWAADEAS